MTKTDWKQVYMFSLHPRDSVIPTDKSFAEVGDGRMGGSHWTCFT